MKIKKIEPAPSLGKLPIPDELIEILRKLSSIIHKTNNEYLYWDKFKYLNFPDGISKNVAWSIVKLTRQSQLTPIPLRDTSDNYFMFWLPDAAQQALHHIDLWFGGRIGLDIPTLDSQKYVVSSLMEEAIASSQLEGAATTRKVAKNLLKTGRKPINHHEKMIVNNYLTIKRISSYKDNELSPELILELHESMTKGTLDNSREEGRFRISDDIRVFDGQNNTILHTPPPAKELLDRVNALCSFANSTKDESTFMHPVIKAILLHFWLAYDHPFTDGNGRTARALFYWYMRREQYWLFEFLSISRIFLDSRARYEKAYLYSEQDGQDVTYFIIYHLHVIKTALSKLKVYIQTKQEELKRLNYLIGTNISLNHRQKTLVRHAIDNAGFIYTIDSHRNSLGISYPTARNDLLDLVKKELLIADQSERYWQFIAPNDLTQRLSGKS